MPPVDAETSAPVLQRSGVRGVEPLGGDQWESGAQWSLVRGLMRGRGATVQGPPVQDQTTQSRPAAAAAAAAAGTVWAAAAAGSAQRSWANRTR